MTCYLSNLERLLYSSDLLLFTSTWCNIFVVVVAMERLHNSLASMKMNTRTSHRYVRMGITRRGHHQPSRNPWGRWGTSEEATIFLHPYRPNLRQLQENTGALPRFSSWYCRSVYQSRICGEPLEVVHNFPYFGSIISRKVTIDSEIQHRIQSACVAFGKFWNRAFGVHDIKVRTKLYVYSAIVLSTLLYGAETWTLYHRHLKSLEAFHQRSLRIILRIHWSAKITNMSVLEQAEITSNAYETEAALGWTCTVDGRPQTTKTVPVW